MTYKNHRKVQQPLATYPRPIPKSQEWFFNSFTNRLHKGRPRYVPKVILVKKKRDSICENLKLQIPQLHLWLISQDVKWEVGFFWESFHRRTHLDKIAPARLSRAPKTQMEDSGINNRNPFVVKTESWARSSYHVNDLQCCFALGKWVSRWTWKALECSIRHENGKKKNFNQKQMTIAVQSSDHHSSVGRSSKWTFKNFEASSAYRIIYRYNWFGF